MIYLLFAVGGMLFMILAAWLLEALTSRADDTVLLSTDERVATERFLFFMRQFEEDGFPALNRRQIWTRIRLIWQATRVTALRSGLLGALAWLGLFGLVAFALSVKTLFRPRAHDLRLLLGGNEFIAFFVAKRRSGGGP